MPRTPILQALAAIALWGILALLALRLSRMPPFLLVGAGLLVGSLCGLHKLREWRVPPVTLLLGIYGLFAFHFCLFMALRYAPPVEANLINYLWPLLIVVLAPVFLPGHRLQPQHIAGALLGFSGAGLIVTGGTFGFDASHWAGYAFAAVSAFIWASYSLLTKRVPRFANSAIGLFCACAGLLSLLMHWVLEPRYDFAAADLPLLLLLGLGPMGAAFFLWDAALKAGDPRVIGSLAYLTPLLSTVALVAGGSGAFTPVTGIAMALIIGGAVLGSR